MKSWGSRYGFIITDKHFVVLRITRLPTREGLAAGREPRAIVSAVPGYSPDSSGLDLFSLDSSFANTTTLYADDDPNAWDLYDLEYIVVP